MGGVSLSVYLTVVFDNISKNCKALSGRVLHWRRLEGGETVVQIAHIRSWYRNSLERNFLEREMWILKTSIFRIHFPLATTSHTAFPFQKCVPTEPGKNRKVAGYIKLIKILVAKKPDHSTKTLASQGLLNIELCKLPSPVNSAARTY